MGEVLRHCMSPPDPQAVSAAVDQLQAMGAMDEEEVLTALGQHLNQMPMDPRYDYSWVVNKCDINRLTYAL